MSSCPTRVISSRALCVLLLAMLALAVGGCKRTPAELPGASAEPAAAVRTLAHALQRNDLLGYARAAVPPAQYQRLQQAWSEDRSRWPNACPRCSTPSPRRTPSASCSAPSTRSSAARRRA
ncbi:hypothetical protein [uncultured Xanthomonas sp.]|uniref:hypothetical protein n=1 Tax=uncultured Xanthomonas sp. TaxID=152831 RepID=UPI0031BAB9C7